MRNARELHSALQVAVQRYREAEQNVVTVFAEIFSSHAYREFGYAAITEYMVSEFGFSDSKARQFVMLARAMQAMPELASAVQSQELEWTKAVDVARSATPRSASAWVEKAKTSTRAELRREIQRSRAAGAEAPGLFEAAPPAAAVLECTTDFHLRLDAVQLERYERALARLRQAGQTDVESILRGLEMQLESQNGSVCRQAASVAETLVVIHDCPSCETAHVKSSRGDRALKPAARASARCDATIQEDGKRSRTVPPRVRRQTLERDGFRCTRCQAARGLQVHHLHERQFGGGHELGNLKTLCRACHELFHELRLE